MSRGVSTAFQPNAICMQSRKLQIGWKQQKKSTKPRSVWFPDEALDVRGIRHTWAMIYGLEDWGSFFTNRQALALATLIKLVCRAGSQIQKQTNTEFARAAQTCLALAVSRETDKLSSIARWDTSRENPQGTFARQALPMLWDFNEVNPL